MGRDPGDFSCPIFPLPHILGKMVEMGFSVQQAQVALLTQGSTSKPLSTRFSPMAQDLPPCYCLHTYQSPEFDGARMCHRSHQESMPERMGRSMSTVSSSISIIGLFRFLDPVRLESSTGTGCAASFFCAARTFAVSRLIF